MELEIIVPCDKHAVYSPVNNLRNSNAKRLIHSTFSNVGRGAHAHRHNLTALFVVS